MYVKTIEVSGTMVSVTTDENYKYYWIRNFGEKFVGVFKSSSGTGPQGFYAMIGPRECVKVIPEETTLYFASENEDTTNKIEIYGTNTADCPFNAGKRGGDGGGDNTHYKGTTTTALENGSTTNPITIDGESYTAVFGDVVVYGYTEFVFDGAAWSEFGRPFDTTPTSGSMNAVTSDGIYRAIEVEHIELTQAQYDALSPAEKSNGKVYFIIDAVSECDFTAEQMAVINSHTIALSYPNLVDKNAEGVTKDGYYNSTGTWVDASGFYQSDYIPVVGDRAYTSMPHNVFVLWYNNEKNYIGQTTSQYFNSHGYASAPSNAAYGRFITTADYYDTWQVENSLFSTEYVPYGTARKCQNTSYNGMIGVAFGSSLTYRAQTTGGYLVSLQEMSGVTWNNYGIGSGMIYTDDTRLSILAKIKGKTSTFYQNKGICLIEGFVNDWYQNRTLGTFTDTEETTACGCLRSAIDYILTANPTITLFIVLDHYGKGITDESAVNAGGLTQYEYYEMLAKVADSMGVPVIKLYKNSGINHYTANKYLIDNIHPNALGAKQTANTIWQSIVNIPAKL